LQKSKIDVCVLCCLSGFPTVPQDLDHPFCYRFLCVGFRNVNNVAAGFDAFNEAEIASGGCDLPLA
jgi:hypothetical protein